MSDAIKYERCELVLAMALSAGKMGKLFAGTDEWEAEYKVLTDLRADLRAMDSVSRIMTLVC